MVSLIGEAYCISLSGGVFGTAQVFLCASWSQQIGCLLGSRGPLHVGSSPAGAEVVNAAPPLSVRLRTGLPTGPGDARARCFRSLGCQAVAEEGCEGAAVSGSQRWDPQGGGGSVGRCGDGFVQFKTTRGVRGGGVDAASALAELGRVDKTGVVRPEQGAKGSRRQPGEREASL